MKRLCALSLAIVAVFGLFLGSVHPVAALTAQAPPLSTPQTAKLVLVDEAHDNQLSLDQSRAEAIEAATPWNNDWRWFYLNQLKTNLSDAYQLVNDPGTPLTYEQLQAYEALIIPHHNDALSDAEVAAVRRYVSGGGGLILLGDCGYGPPNPELAAGYGIEFDPYCIFAEYEAGQEAEGNIDITNFDPLHEATDSVSSYHQNWGQSLNLSGDAYQLGDTWRDDSEAWRDWMAPAEVYNPGEEGVFSVVGGTDTGCGRVAAVSDNTFADAPLEGWTQNDQIIRGLLDWVTGGPSCPVETADILFDELHNNYLTLDRDRAQEIVDGQGWGEVENHWLSILPARLSDEFAFERAASGALTAERLAGYEALVIPWYLDNALSGDEVQAVKEYVSGGGGLVLIGDCAFDNPNPELATAFGIEFDVHCLRAPQDNSDGDIVIDSFANHAAVADLTELTLSGGQSLDLSGDAFWLADTDGRDAWRDKNWNGQYDDGTDEPGVFDVVGAYDGYGRVVAIADDAFGDVHMDWTENDEALRHLLRWVTADPGPPETPTWTLQTIDSAGEVGEYTAIGVDSQNYPHISYYDSINWDLRYAYLDASGWHTETVDSYEDVGVYTDLALDGNDYPHISYSDSTWGWVDLKYAYMDATGWHTETVDGDSAGFHSSIALDDMGYPHISYYASGDGHLRYAYQDGGGWHIETADDGYNVGEYTSLALDAAGYPHISYYDQENGYLKVAYRDGSGWHHETVDSSADVGTYTSLALDRDGYPHISYHDRTYRDLKYAYQDASGWHIETLDSTDMFAMYGTSLALDDNQQPHISYYDRTRSNLKYAYHNETGWHLDTIDDGTWQGSWSSLALDGVGRAHISYWDGENTALKYALIEFPAPREGVPTEFYRRAALHLESFRGVDDGWAEAFIDEPVLPLYRPDVEGVAYYEFPCATMAGGIKQPAGFIVVSTGPHDFPIPHFSAEGLPPSRSLELTAETRTLLAVSNSETDKVYRLDSLSYAGENAQGELTGLLGDLPPKPVGLDPAWLNEPPEDSEVEWLPVEPSTDDGSAGQLSYTTVVTGPEPPPQLELQSWTSWEELKAVYSDTFGAHLDKLADEAAEEWEAEEHVSQEGVILYTRDVHDMALLYDVSSVDVTGSGAAYVEHEIVASPPALRIRVTGMPPEDPEELLVTAHYDNGIDDTVAYMVAARHFIWTPLLSRASSGGAMPSPTAIQASSKHSGTSNGWHWYQAGWDSEQPLYDQIPKGQWPNTSSCWSGCGATAWSMLFGWADHQAGSGNSYWSGRWGLYRWNGGTGSDVTAPLYQSTGVKNMMWEIRGHIDTFCVYKTNQGATAPWNMDEAQDYLAGRTGTKLRTRYNRFAMSTDSLRNQVRDVIKYQGSPVIVGTGWYIGGHYPVAYGYAYRNYDVCYGSFLGRCVVKDTKTDHLFRINYGWGGGNQKKGWVGASTWFAGWIYP